MLRSFDRHRGHPGEARPDAKLGLALLWDLEKPLAERVVNVYIPLCGTILRQAGSLSSRPPSLL